MVKYFEIREHPGWTGIFSMQQHPAAKFPNGSRVEKILCEPGDDQLLGAKGTVLGPVSSEAVGIGCFVEFDYRPHAALIQHCGRSGDG
jgi:hypothetical protein